MNQMTATDNIRNSIIDKLLTISNNDYLTALYQILSKNSENDEVIRLSEDQLLMLNMSEGDIKFGRITSQDDLDQADLEWLKSL